jgi:uncharacterized protein (TIGR02231 family)
MANILIKKQEIDLNTNSKTCQVTIFSDRAQVTRSQQVQLKQGENTVVFTNLGTGIVEQTIKPAVESKALKITSTTLENHTLYFFKQAEHQKNYNQIISSLKEIITILDRKTAFALENHLISDLRDYIKSALNDIILEQDISIPRLKQALQFLDKLIQDNTTQVLNLNEQYYKLDEQLGILKQELAVIRELDKRTQDNIVVTIMADKAQQVEVKISYIITGAAWKTSYDTAIDTDTGDVELSYFGEVVQKTGEQWQDVKVVLSTTVSEESIEIPRLYPVYLDGYVEKHKREVVVERKVTRDLKDEGEQEELELDEDITTGAQEAERDQRVAIEKKAATYTFSISKPSTIPPDGRYHRLLILKENYKADTFYETVPELLEYVYLKATINNNTDMPLLPGRVMVYRNGSYMGRSKLDYIAPTEEFAISFGIDEDLRVKRIVMKSYYEKAKGLNLKNLREYKYKYLLFNYKGQATTVKLKEIVHVSEISKVKVKIEEDTTKDYELNDDGIICWQAKLPSKQSGYKEYILHYTIQSPKSFSLDSV